MSDQAPESAPVSAAQDAAVPVPVEEEEWDEEKGCWVTPGPPPPPRPSLHAFDPLPDEQPPEPKPEPTPEPIAAAPIPPIKRGRGRPRKNPVVAAPVVGGVEKSGPTKDRAYFAKVMSDLNEANRASIESGSGGIQNYKASLEGVMFEAKLNGVDPQAILDGRSEHEVARAAIHDFAVNAESILEKAEPVLKAIDALMDLADDLSGEFVMKETLKIKSKEQISALGKRMRGLVELVRRLRYRATTPHPKIKTPKKYERQIYEAAWMWRYAAYVMRTNLSDRQQKGGVDALLTLKWHHLNMSWAIFKAKTGQRVRLDKETGKHWYENLQPSKGAIIIRAPGMGKTTGALAFCALELSRNNYLKLLTGHAIEDMAKSNLTYLSSFFSDDNPMGRRNIALYPGIALKSRNTSEFKLKTNDRSKAPTGRAFGANAELSGGDADLYWGDDMVAQAEREQPEERRRKYETIEFRWKARLRDANTAFHLTTCTIWHDEDANARVLQKIRAGKMNVMYDIVPCGGPEKGPLRGVFESIWPELYPSSFLRERWEADPALYACAYMCDPRPMGMRIIRKLRYYDPAAPEHAEFMRAAQRHLTVDPAATKNKSSDKAALLDVAVGDVIGEARLPTGVTERRSERRARIVAASEILTTIPELKGRIANHCLATRTDYVHVETQDMNSHALKGMFDEEFGVQMVPHPTGPKSKETRLRAVGVMIDDTRPTPDFGGAVVEFPGKWNENLKRMEPDPGYFWLYEQFLNFGNTKSDHAVDALTQLLSWLARMGELVAGAGWVSQAVRSVAVSRGDPAVAAMVAGYERGPEKPRNVELADLEFMRGHKGVPVWN